jgi:hypothetical protein
MDNKKGKKLLPRHYPSPHLRKDKGKRKQNQRSAKKKVIDK